MNNELEKSGLKNNMLTKSMRLSLLALGLMTATAAAQTAEDPSANEQTANEQTVEQAPKDVPINESVERHLPGDQTFRPLARDPGMLQTEDGDRVEKQQVAGEVMETVKLGGIIAPLHFDSGAIRIRDRDIEKIRRAMESVRGKANVRLHLVGHADNQRLSPELTAQYGDNQGLSRERAGEVAETLQRALSLPPEGVAFEGMGDTKPVASNATDAGRAQNRRVEVEVWYDEPKAATKEQEVVVKADLRQIKVCRVQELCLMRFQEGHEKRTRVNNLVTALHYGEEGVDVTPEFVEQVRKGFANLQGKQNVTAKFIGYADDIALSDRNARIYGDATALSKARAHRAALAVQQALGLPAAAVQSDGRGATTFVAANDTPQGRALNRRIEVQFWYDDPMQELPEEPQMCPAEADNEIVTRIHQPSGGTLPTLQLDGSEIVIPVGMTDRLRSALDEVKDRDHARLRFIGYTGNERLDRRTASAYEDDIGLSAARARRAMDTIRSLMELSPEQVEHEGHGFVQVADASSEGFVQGPDSYIEVQVVYDEPVLRDDYEGVDITRLTRELTPHNAFGLNPMHISVNGEPLDDPGRSSADVQRCTDVALDKAGIRFQFDDLKAEPRLSVSASPQVALVDEPVRFRMYSNYGSFFQRAEVLIQEKGQSAQAAPLAAVTLDANGEAEWQPAIAGIPSAGRELQYVLRVYDDKGRFDETSPRPLWLVHAKDDGSVADVPAMATADGAPPPLAGYGESHIAKRNIRIGGNTVAVRGSSIPEGHTVWVAGRPVPVDAKGDFIAEEILPEGLHTVEVAVLDPEGNGNLYLRDLEMRSRDRFFVGVADLTVSKNSTSGPADLLQGENTGYERSSSFDGRLAFFGTEKFGNGWRVTGSADTREGPVKDIFGNFLDKAPDALFRRIDPDYHYPTFGDDGIVEEMAPTLGKFYLRAEHGDDFAMWGNFKTDYSGNEMAQVDRGLYGADAEWKADATTSFGERRASVSGFAAEPGTIGGREEFRGTGGSLFYLHNQDILTGSERLRIEMRDKDSQLVTGTIELRPGLDYDIDYLQGRVLLAEPLSSTGSDNMLVRSGGLSGSEAWLVARYEYTPGFDKIDTLTTGGQAHVWVNDHVGIGLTGSRSSGDADDSSVAGMDLTLRKSDETWLKLQGGRTTGLASNSQYSYDGGFGFSSANPSAFDNAAASGYRADFSLGVGDIFKNGKGKVTLYTQAQDAGYSAPGLGTTSDRTYYGGTLDLPIGDKLSVVGKADHREQDAGLTLEAAEVNVKYQLNDRWSVATGVRNDKREDQRAVVPLTQEQGQRTDGVVHLGYDSASNWNAWGFAQGTLSKDGDRQDNGRIGAGAAVRGKKFRVEAEASAGDLGPGGRVGTSYMVSDKTSLYLNYALENERGDLLDGSNVSGQRGSLVGGMKHRLTDSSSVYAEERYQDANEARGLTHAAGMSLNLDDYWTVGANAELGTLQNSETAAETDRRAGGVRVAYNNGPTQVSSGVEYRNDDAEQTDATHVQRTTWLFRNNFKFQMSDDWRLVGKLDHSYSESSQGQFYDGKFTEGVVGFGYRPVLHNRLNALAKYTYFYNVPTTDQVALNGTAAQFIQKSHIASVDANYEVTPSWSVGGKYAYRLGSVSLDRENPEFFDNRAQLVILRTDVRLFDQWEGLLEARRLQLPDLDESRSGMLLAVYRYFGEHVKAGVGYNFTDFSENLTDLSYRHRGVFLNVVGAL